MLAEEFTNWIKEVADEKRIPRDNVIQNLKNAIIKSYEWYQPEEKFEINIDLDKNLFEVFQILKVCENYDDLDDYTEISIDDVKKNSDGKNLKVNDVYKKRIDLNKIPREIINEIQKNLKYYNSSDANVQIYNEWINKVGVVIKCEVEKIDSNGTVYVNLTNGILGEISKNEQIPGEKLIPGNKYDFYVKRVKQNSQNWPVELSRADIKLIEFFLRTQIPEIQEGIIEIKKIARIPGFKTKIAVISNNNSISAVGTIIGFKGMRIIEISKLINNEKIEVIEYSNDFNRLAYNCCLPVELQGIIIDEPENPKEKRNITLVVKDADLPLIIGKKGFNTWIISQLLNADIDTLAYEDAVEGKIEFTPISVEKNTRRSNIKRNDHHVKVNNVTTKRINDEFIDNLDFTDEFNDDKGKKKQKNNSYE